MLPVSLGNQLGGYKSLYDPMIPLELRLIRWGGGNVEGQVRGGLATSVLWGEMGVERRAAEGASAWMWDHRMLHVSVFEQRMD